MTHYLQIAVSADGVRAECACTWVSDYYQPADFYAAYDNASGDVTMITDGEHGAIDAAGDAGDEHLAEVVAE